MPLRIATENIMESLRLYLTQVDEAAYKQPVEALSNATLGQHTRHTIEFFQCITEQSGTGVLSYDDRKRNALVEQSPRAALEALDKVASWFQSSSGDKHLLLRVSSTADSKILISSSLIREWNYAVEHAIHHMAMIRIGVKFVAPGLQLPDNFGVAPATIKYRNQQCAQ